MATEFEFSFASLANHLKNISFIDIIDIILVAALFYLVYAFIRDRRAGKLAAGILVFLGIMVLSNVIGLKTMSYIFANFFQIGFIALVVVFQPELRSALEKMGTEPLKGLKTIGDVRSRNEKEMTQAIDGICDACRTMSETRTGALIVIERVTNLDSIVHGGTTVNADISSPIILNIFYEGSPLHDGAIIIRDWRISRAAVRLPLSENDAVLGNLGTRHHAALGISEESDSVVIVVSEQTGIISLAVDGKMKRRVSPESLRTELNGMFELTKKSKKKAEGQI